MTEDCGVAGRMIRHGILISRSSSEVMHAASKPLELSVLEPALIRL